MEYELPIRVEICVVVDYFRYVCNSYRLHTDGSMSD